jgi:hypothetical protein
VAWTPRVKKSFRILVGKLFRKYTLERSKCRREDNCKIVCAEGRWIELAED